MPGSFLALRFRSKEIDKESESLEEWHNPEDTVSGAVHTEGCVLGKTEGWANRRVIEQSEGKAVSDFLSPAAPAAHCGHTLDLVSSSPHHSPAPPRLLTNGSHCAAYNTSLPHSLHVLQAKSNHPGISEIIFEPDTHLPTHCKPMAIQFTQIFSAQQAA